jgi:uncharacterized membrane protein YdbT with pleckstrin-like domain
MNIDLMIHRKPGENVIFYLRRHPIIYIGDVIMVAALGLIPVIGDVLMHLIWPSLLTGPISRPLLVLLASAYYLILWLFFLSSFVDFYLDAWVVTDDRIVNVKQRGLFSRTVSELDLAKVQDVTSEVRGFLSFVFNYGSVFVQTAGETERFHFEQIANPHAVRKQLLGLVEADRKKQGEVKLPTE